MGQFMKKWCFEKKQNVFFLIRVLRKKKYESLKSNDNLIVLTKKLTSSGYLDNSFKSK